jgi:arylformamidase
MKFFDVTRPIYPGMAVYPGDPEVVVRRVSSIRTGAPANVSMLSLGSHTGTHVDPPLHIREGAPAVDQLPLDVLIGPARLYEVAVRGQIDAASLVGLDLAACPRVLFRVCSSSHSPQAGGRPEAAGIGADAVEILIQAGVRLVGLEDSSADPPESADFPAHRTLLGAGVIIVEGLDLSAVPPGPYELLCLPLKLRGGDGAPARVILRAGV